MPFRDRVARKLGETVSNGPQISVFALDSFLENSGPEAVGSLSPSSSSSPGARGKERGQGGAAEEGEEDENSFTFSPSITLTPDSATTPDTSPSPRPNTGRKRSAVDADGALAPVNAARVAKRPPGRPPGRPRALIRAQNQRAIGPTRTSARLTGRGTQLSPEKAYLSYYDILLTYEDVKALKADWLTDNNIAFWEEWLEREVLPKYPQARICLLRPSMTFLLMRDADIKGIAGALPTFNKVTHIFLPVNDNRDVARAEGGSHWSLLLVSTIDRVAFHYDSLGGANYSEGKLCAGRLSRILGVPLKFQQLDDCPQQENASDCGVFVCILMRHLLVKRLLNANAREKVSMSMANKMIDSYGGRKEMMRIIESLRKEGERRRSASPFASSSHTPPRIE